MDGEREDLLGNLFSSERCGVLATSGVGGPYTSLLAFAHTKDFASILFCTSRHTTKFCHLLEEPRAAFLIDNRNNAVKMICLMIM
jgi:nitroimidazol reductase NimA-like FMN-containing flavoprotein (pyridoxamine 5'-phosphate oxidase superfamily)